VPEIRNLLTPLSLREPAGIKKTSPKSECRGGNDTGTRRVRRSQVIRKNLGRRLTGPIDAIQQKGRTGCIRKKEVSEDEGALKSWGLKVYAKRIATRKRTKVTLVGGGTEIEGAGAYLCLGRCQIARK